MYRESIKWYTLLVREIFAFRNHTYSTFSKHRKISLARKGYGVRTTDPSVKRDSLVRNITGTDDARIKLSLLMMDDKLSSIILLISSQTIFTNVSPRNVHVF